MQGERREGGGRRNTACCNRLLLEEQAVDPYTPVLWMERLPAPPHRAEQQALQEEEATTPTGSKHCSPGTPQSAAPAS